MGSLRLRFHAPRATRAQGSAIRASGTARMRRFAIVGRHANLDSIMPRNLAVSGAGPNRLAHRVLAAASWLDQGNSAARRFP
jgi:hypothetical protein